MTLTKADTDVFPLVNTHL
uniref:Uncharacterized protein n=1 Tax=Anguilla anguilla TaxID=7936 RepID=A0A0E9SR30_ANGAN